MNTTEQKSASKSTETTSVRQLYDDYISQYPRPFVVLRRFDRATYDWARVWFQNCMEEVDQASLIGVWMAATNYNPARGPFPNYAKWWIRACVRDLGYTFTPLSDQTSLSSDYSCTNTLYPQRYEAQHVSGEAELKENITKLDRELAKLPDRTRKIIELKYGLKNNKPHSVNSICKKVKAGKITVKAKMNQGLDKLRKEFGVDM